MSEELQERNQIEGEGITDWGVENINSGEKEVFIRKKRKVSANSLANLIPLKKGDAIRKGKFLTQEQKEKGLIRRSARALAKEAIEKAEFMAQLKAPAAIKQTWRLSKKDIKDQRVQLDANKVILSVAGLMGQKGNTAVAVQVNFKEKGDQYE